VIDATAFGSFVERLRDSLRGLGAAGIPELPCSARSRERLLAWGRPRPAAMEGLSEIRADLGDCRRCKLAGHRRRIVFGAGAPRAQLMFVGEGPGREEDEQGEPFVGEAGRLLDRIIAAIRLRREDVYITNVVKCRPPGNRLPEPDEIRACMPFLRRQIAAVKPRLICTLGGCAAQSLLETTEPISRLRGRFFDRGGIRVLPTFHPAYLLRTPEKKREVWEDMKRLMREYPYADDAVD
jgi:DNA polymerase